MVKDVADSRETIEALLRLSRRTALPIRRSFVQAGAPRKGAGPGSLSWFVKAHHHRALDQYLLFHAAASAPPFNVTRDGRLWARALGLGDTPSSIRAVSKNWAWLGEKQLIARGRIGRTSSPALLREDGSGVPYVHPSVHRDAYFKLPYDYWVDKWDLQFDLPAKALLLIALSLEDDFVLPLERVKNWYGISADTAGRGLASLAEHGLIRSRRIRKKAPLAPLGFAVDTHYTLRAPFGPRGRRQARR
jgi:hypothetical protein